jgi:hypothetical protein
MNNQPKNDPAIKDGGYTVHCMGRGCLRLPTHMVMLKLRSRLKPLRSLKMVTTLGVCEYHKQKLTVSDVVDQPGGWERLCQQMAGKVNPLPDRDLTALDFYDVCKPPPRFAWARAAFGRIT